MDLATDETVLADFDNAILEHYGITSRFFRDGKKFMVHTESDDGSLKDFEVKYVFGVEPLQQYMVEIKPPSGSVQNAIGKVQVLRLSWDTENGKWFYLDPPDVREKLEPGDPLHWTGITQNWNSSCAYCHSTDLKKNFDIATQTFNTTYSEIDVSCEACHGPGSHHVEMANKKSLFWDRKRGFGLAKLKVESNRPQVEVCAPCHSRRREIADGFYAGCNFQEYFDPSLLHDRLYHCDGQIRDEVYVYGSFTQSKMYHQNIKCTDCHDPHSTKVKFNDNRLCTSCHQHPAAKYDSPEHHHHQPGSTGSFCVECHMPTTTYMAVDARRDHSFRVPRPDLSLKTGAPNACTGCHIGTSTIPNELQGKIHQYLDWIDLSERGNVFAKNELKKIDRAMTDATSEWYGESVKPENYGPAFHDARRNLDMVASSMRPLINRASVPTIVRATAASELARTLTPETLDAAFKAVGESEPKIIAAGLARLESEISFQLGQISDPRSTQKQKAEIRKVFDRVAPLLVHSDKVVRIEAVRVMISVPPEMRKDWLTTEQKTGFTHALQELITSLEIMKERGQSHRVLGSLHESMGDIQKAEDHYRTAILLDPNLTGPRWNLALLVERRGQQLDQQARQLIAQQNREQAMRVAKESGETLAEAQKLRDEEHECMLTDLKRMEKIGQTDQLHYQVGMSFYRRGNMELTEFHLRKAYEITPSNERNVRALAVFFEFRRDWNSALRYARELVDMKYAQPSDQLILERIIQSSRDEIN